jgi:hypothetical protein
MVNVRDAAVLLHGVVLQVTPRTRFINDKPSDELDGANVMLSGAGGIAVVKVHQKAVDAGLLPGQGEMAAFICSPYAYAREQGMGNMGYSFIRHASMADLDEINAHLSALAGASGK